MNVLQISPFAIPAAPASGGLIRIAETARAYEAAGCRVRRCSIVTRDRDRQGPLDLSLNWWERTRRRHLGPPKNLGPIRIRWATEGSDRLATALAARITETVDVIHLEHPWAIAMVAALRQHPHFAHSRLVYGSHNHESALHESLWKRADHWNDAARRLAMQIDAAERQTVQSADLCWAVSDADALALTALGARQVIVAPNACRPLPPRRAHPGVPTQPFALFVGGDYAPNIQGFLRWIGHDLNAIRSPACLVMAGAAGDRLAQHPPVQTALTQRRVLNLGRVGQDLLDQLIAHARCIVLPIDDGGGTNLKTAEALLSKRPVLATPASLRGFEAWADAQGVHRIEEPDAFARTLGELLSGPDIADASRDNLDRLTWGHSLSQAVQHSLA